MRDILISSAVCLACLLVALASQLVAPTPALARDSQPAAVAAAATATNAPWELDPDEANPRLFSMAPDTDDTLAQAGGKAADLLRGDPLIAAKERTTASGLRITDLVLGTGAEAVSGRTVTVNYRGTLTSGKEFDSSYGRGPFSFPLGAGRVIRGWDEGVAGMREGGKRKLVIPPDLGYSDRGAGGVIPPNATLVFEVELLKVGR
jgi:FKBP-type peptidyl-prolyl cis-trans isomerase